MKWGFNKQSKNNDREAIVAVSQLRAQVGNRLQEAYKRLDPQDAFGRAASQASAEESMVGSLLFSMLTWAPFFQGLEMGLEAETGENLSLFDAAASPTLCAVFDGVSMIWDDKANKNRQRRLNDYPEGRRQDPIFERPLNRRFNLVSANDNSRFQRDAQAEIACMSEMLDMLDDMEAEGVSMLRLDPADALYDTMKELAAAKRYDSVVTRFSAPVRKAA